MFDLTNKVALITGASSGIGRACVVALAGQGAKVAAAARRFDRLEKLTAEEKGKNHDVLPVKMDVTVKTDIDMAVAKTVAAFGRLDILVNNAGVVEWNAFMDMTEAQWDKTLDTNLKGYFLVAQRAAREMGTMKWGRIINIASVASGGVGIGFPSIAHYCASKGGIVAMTEAMADELAPMGILVNCIGPGLVESEMTKDILANPQQMAGFLPRIPLKRAGKPEEIAAAVVYLASEEASYTTGATLYVDGGWLAS